MPRGGHAMNKMLLQLGMNAKEAENLTAFYQQYFPEHFYLSLCRTGRADEENYIKAAVPFAFQHNIPLVAVNDVVFLKPDDFEAHEIRVAIHDSYTLDDPKRPKKYSVPSICAYSKCFGEYG